MKQEDGFTLIEVVASLVILTLILMFFSSIFVQNNKVAIRNSDKLVVTNIADAYLERLKVQKFEKTANCSGMEGSTFYEEYELNNYKYDVEIQRLNTFNDMCNTIVTVTGKDGKATGVVEGYVNFKQ